MEHEENYTPEVAPTAAPAATTQPRTSIAMPIAIVVAGIAIAAAILSANGTLTKMTGTSELPDFGGAALALTPVDPALDHIIGNPDAPVVLVEYSDFDCPYCQIFHRSMEQLIAEHGTTGSVAWVYRSLPIISKDSPTIANAAECIARIDGNDAFWKFGDALFDRAPGTHFDIATLSAKVAASGVDMTAYNECMTSGAANARIQALMDNAIGLGVTGTPATFAIVKGKVYPIEGGALPYAQLTQKLSQIIEAAKK